ncbi:hypothetical protein PX52LOC_02821 [Limnoglobus roseus]|uniref:Uncharacterized protein n=1 Tax=Limnoglobus roseus TaxID=2598579 RepID=A0A5C1ABD0_9BACT|nr:hypothetical protein PX52LOC_02821 [Limnoglobus roseus]
MPPVLQVQTISAEGDESVCQLHCPYPYDNYDFEASKSLALQIVWDAWSRLRDGYFKPKDDPREFGIFCPLPADEASHCVAESGIEFYMPNEWDPSWFEENADRFIPSASVSDRVNCGHLLKTGDRSLWPACRFRFCVSDPLWLLVLPPGLEWQTRIFPMEWR